jgi:hypothetical protein
MWSFHVIHLFIHSNTHTLIYFFCSVVVKVHDHLESCQAPTLGDPRHLYDHLAFTSAGTLQFWGYDRGRFDYSARDHGPPTLAPFVRPKPPAGPPPDDDDDDVAPPQSSLGNVAKAPHQEGRSAERFQVSLRFFDPGQPKAQPPTGPPPPKASRDSTFKHLFIFTHPKSSKY